ncbi:phosphomethylpyrimidine synthase ThiC [Desulfofundulus thermosubterraneus]|uniref:Phosphomethylpyrimidine synthase n=1 Tax=Desulfofundulus thermosubterraneus DSM 16057 TaxID=1121432 RepID=A0A1M6M6L5_9FIRM|nr:phosphomethylpyrimidine synthase ThiC [Desulfofundulus thermosubterraneus]SHJ79078.1 phosphomethylpyrimidine synthase [Desulfofundulus thermosubterraneus DSM 16057]
MPTQMARALAGEITPEMKRVAGREGLDPEFVRRGVAEGTIVIPRNRIRKNIDPVGIGAGLAVKVSASVGLAGEGDTIEGEVAKVRAAVEAGTDAIMDLSVCGDIDGARRAVLAATTTPVGTLPVYQALAEAREKYGAAVKMKVDEMFEVIERQAADGVDFLALHCATTWQTLRAAGKHRRIDYLVSHGGSHLMGWMIYNQKENPLYEHFDRLLEICRRYDVVLSLADGWRPGCLADSLDAAQVQELVVLGELVARARQQQVQVMVKGPGHVPLGHLKATVQLEKQLCHGAPYFVFGPVVTDIAPGYDHITAAIGGALAAWAGAEFLCYVTAAEHLGLPGVEQVREGVVAARIAAHAADVAREPRAAQWDLEMSRARKALDWDRQIELALDPGRAGALRRERSRGSHRACAMCGKYCAMQVVGEYLGKEQGVC